ncbi:MAG: ribose-5-phosphate isomerase RpiA [Pseudomonadota bacterium]
MTVFLPLSQAEQGKLVSAVHAAQYVRPGMRLGLGTGSTAAWLVRYLAYRNRKANLGVTCVATSSVTAQQAKTLGLSLSSLEDTPNLNLVVDGADEFDPQLNLIKGAGGALLQEKLVAVAADQMVVITDPSKEKAKLGAFPLSVEIVRFGWQGTAARIEHALGVAPQRRMVGSEPFVTDEGNFIVDLAFGQIDDARAVHNTLKSLTGVVETGLFLDIATRVVIGAPAGAAQVLEKGGRVTHPWPEDVDLTELAEILVKADPNVGV